MHGKNISASTIFPSLVQLQWLQLLLTLAAIILHFVLLFTDLPPLLTVPAADIPLIAVAAVCGIPLAIQIFLKLLRRDFGADMLAIIALLTGVWLGEYLAAGLIILMLTGGQVLEAYAMRKASSALRALADRMPSLAHRKRGDDVEEIAA